MGKLKKDISMVLSIIMFLSLVVGVLPSKAKAAAVIPTLTAISSGSYHSIALKSDGTVVTWGGDGSRQLGGEVPTSTMGNVQVKGPKNVVSVVAAGSTSYAVEADGSLWSWGANNLGQLGNGNTSVSSTIPTKSTLVDNVKSISSNGNNAVVLKKDGTVWVWGYNFSGQLGNGSTSNNLIPTQVVPGVSGIIQVTAASNATFLLKSDGTVLVAGQYVGDGTTTAKTTFAAVANLSGTKALATTDAGSMHVIKNDGSVWGWGPASSTIGDGTKVVKTSPVKLSGISDVASIYGGGTGVIALTTDGTVYNWGTYVADPAGSEKLSPGILSSVPTARTASAGISGDYFLVLSLDGTSLWGWGPYNSSGQIGDGTTNAKPTPVISTAWINQDIPEISSTGDIAAGYSHGLLLKTNGTVWAWGRNNNGQLGNGTTSNSSVPMQVPSLTGIIRIVAGYNFNLALKNDGTVWAWGDNSFGQLGDGTKIQRNSPIQISSLTNVVDIGAGAYHSLAVQPDGSLFSWGDNSHGQLGDGSTSSKSSPIKVPSLTAVKTAKGGLYHTAAIKLDGTVYSWGFNSYGQVGDGTTVDKTSPTRSGSISRVAQISVSSNHTMSLGSDGSVYGWGANNYGELGGLSTSPNVPTLSTIVDSTKISLGVLHELAIRSDGTVWASGNNGYGQLGNGNTANQNALTRVQGISDVVDVVAGSSFSIALTGDGKVWSWGDNGFGQLGNGTTTSTGNPTALSGDLNSGGSGAGTSLSAPAEFSATDNNTSVALSWTTVPLASSYQIIRNGVLITTGSGTSFNDTTVTPGVTYTYAVIASNSTTSSSAKLLTITPGTGSGTVNAGSGGTGGSGGGTPTLSTINNLTSLNVSGVTLSPTFSKTTVGYSSTSSTSANSVTVTAVVEDAGSSIKIGNNPQASGVASAPIALVAGPNVITVSVTSAAGTIKNYSVTVIKTLSNVADLSSIFAEGMSISPTFNRNTTSYASSVSNSVDRVRFTVGSYSIYSTIEINGIPVSANITSNYFPLDNGANTFTIAVTAQDGTVKNYIHTITRAGESSNTNLISVSFGGLSVSPSFSPSVTSYVINAPEAVETFSVLAFKSDVNASITVNGLPATSGINLGPLPLISGINTVIVQVQAQNGTTKVYTFLINRGAAAAAKPDISNPILINFRAINVTKTSARLEWNVVTRADSYSVSPLGGSSTVTSNTYLDLTGLSKETTYEYTLVAKNSAGEAIPIATTFKTLGDPPAPPTNFRLVSNYFDALTMSWDVSSGASTYMMMRESTKKVYEGIPSVFKDQTVTASTYYDYLLYAKNDYGMSTPVSLSATTPAAPAIVVSEPQMAAGKITIDFEVITGAIEYHWNRNPHWAYILNDDGTYHRTYDNAVTGETKDLGNVSITNGKLPFVEEGLAVGPVNYKLTAVVKNADGTTSTTPPLFIDGTVTEPTPTAPPTTGGGSSGGSSGGSYGGGSGGGGGSGLADPAAAPAPVTDPGTTPQPTTKDLGYVGNIFDTSVYKHSCSREDLALSSALLDTNGHWSNSHITKLVTKGIIDGYPDSTFRPDSNITRAEFTTLVVKALCLDISEFRDIFGDVKSDDWFSPWVITAQVNGIVEGVSTDRFNPGALITRQEMATIVSRAFEKRKALIQLDSSDSEILSKFVDKNSISEWAVSHVKLLYKNNIMMGRTESTIDSTSNGSRAETAALLERVLYPSK
ncbi:cadherin-like beta sandwich domain-containing protein [Paenibacillus periandrae]|uniref:RCC1 domain-containing protein n=1 Tax=Paenibacillus periandrae TaxID=1761741 RepID=UPI001F09516E|nr:cadherin-like beta sandwich domain-containing protein [Paenibacillus periandrae]